MTDPMEAAGFGVVPRWMIYHPQVDAKMIMLFLVLSSRASGKGICWPSLETLATESRLSRSTVHETLTAMRERGLITWETRTTQRGRVNVYRLLIDPLGAPGGVVWNPDDPSSDPEGGSSGERTTGSPVGGPEVEQGEVEPREPSSSAAADGGSEPGPEPSTEPVEVGLSSEAELFDDFWAHYPKKVSKKDASVAFAKALKTTDYITVRAGLVSAIKSWKADGKVTIEKKGDDLIPKVVSGEPGKGVPHAATWLNGERWTDEHPPADQAGPTGEEAPGWMTRRSD